MNNPLAIEIQQFIVSRFAQKLALRGVPPGSLPDRFDLYAEGVIDSLGLLELVNLIEDQFGVSVDLQGMSPDELTLVGPLSRYLANSVSAGA